MNIQGLELDPADAEGNYARKVQPTEADEAKASLLALLAEGKPYVFLIPELGEDEKGKYILVTANTDIDDPVVLKAVLDTASQSLNLVIEE
jgi:hypothetical protein